jgi:NTP pyrophosphatase (non-canonical NTP hydrolase)
MIEVFTIISNFVSDRPTMRENNLVNGRVEALLTEEVREFLEEQDLEKKAREAVDIIWFLITWASINGIDIEAQIREKAAINTIHYPAHLFTNGTPYEEAILIAKDPDIRNQIAKEFYEFL